MESWSLLEQETWTNPGSYERRLAGTGIHTLYAILIRPDGLVGLALDLPGEAAGNISEDAAKGFVLHKNWNQETGRLRLSLMLSERRYLDVFGVLACDVLEKVVRADTVENGGIALKNRLVHWKKFLKAAGENGLILEEQTGLFGEMFVLRKLIASKVADPARALSAWQGPAGSNQDFYWQGRAVEVKSTTVNDFARVRIANENQLDEDGLLDLHLCHLAFDRRVGAGETLPELVSGLLNVLGESLRDEFLDRLALAGYHKIHEPHYQLYGYTCRFSGLYRIDSQFPRIKRGELRSGVSDVVYLIDLSNINPVAGDIGKIAGGFLFGQS
jgi:hypothetical protein